MQLWDRLEVVNATHGRFVAVLTHLPVADARAEVGGGGQPIVVIVGRGTLVRLLVDVVRQVLMLCRRTAAVVAEDAARDGDEVGAGLATLAAPAVNVPNVAGHDDSKFRKKNQTNIGHTRSHFHVLSKWQLEQSQLEYETRSRRMIQSTCTSLPHKQKKSFRRKKAR